MSRCFPYPPPGYARKVARTEAALIESIKLQSKRRECKTDRKKEESKHKKEKSKDKKHKSKEHKEKSSRSCDHKRKKGLKEANDLLKGTKVEAEQLEKSGLTEEHGQPVWPQSPGYLSDGTQINHKRKRDAALQPNEGCKPGKIIRIKLSSSLSQQDDPLASRERMCSTSGREHVLDQKRDENSRGPIQLKTCFTNADKAIAVKDPKTCLTNAVKTVAVKDPTSSKLKIKDPSSHVVKNISSQGNGVSLPQTRIPAESAHETFSKHKIKDPSSQVVKNISSQGNGLSLPPQTRIPAESAHETFSKHKIKDPSSQVVKNISSQGNGLSLPPQTRIPAESAHETLFDKCARPPRTRSSSVVSYEALFDKWVPPLLQFEQQTGDEEWLSGTRKQDVRTTNKPCSPAPSCRSSSTWPRGQYLADADVYSLPYTIPF